MATKQNPEEPPKRTLSDADLEALAPLVAQNLKAKELKAIAKYVTKGINLIKSPIFLGTFILTVGGACFTAYNLIPHFVKEKFETVFNAEITNAITVEFAEPRISNIVNWAASSEASNILRASVTPQIDKFNQTLVTFTNEYLEAVTTLKSNLVANLGIIEARETNLAARLVDTRKTLRTVEKTMGELQRSIPSEKKEKFITDLTALPKDCNIKIVIKGTTPECTVFADELAWAFSSGGFTDGSAPPPKGFRGVACRVGVGFEPETPGDRAYESADWQTKLYHRVPPANASSSAELLLSNPANRSPTVAAIQKSLYSIGFYPSLERISMIPSNEVRIVIWNKPVSR